VLRPIFDQIFNSEIARLAAANGDTFLALLHDDFRNYDEAYAVENTKALVTYATAKDASHVALLRGWVEKWMPLGKEAARGLSNALATASGADSADAIFQRTMAAQAQLVTDCGL
jgi:toluene monooxygenase system protein E